METGGVGVARRVDQNNLRPLLPRLLDKVGELRRSGTHAMTCYADICYLLAR